MERHVWSFSESDVKFYFEEPFGFPPSGQIVDAHMPGPGESSPIPIFSYCFLQNGTISAATSLVRRGVTMRGRPKIVNPANFFHDITLNVEHLYFRKSVEFDHTNIFKPRRQLQIRMENTDWLYDNSPPLENDTFKLSFAFAQGFEVTGRDNDIMTGTASFLAEMLLP